MSVQDKINRLQNFIATNKALADVPFAVVGGASITPRMALSMLQRGQNVSQIISSLATLGVDPPSDWGLAIQYYQSLLEKQTRTRIKAPTQYIIPKGQVAGKAITVEEAIAHLRAKDLYGISLLESYQSLRTEMARRMQRA